MKKTNAVGESDPAIDGAFLNIIETHRRGSVLSELSAALRQVTAGVQQTGKGGSVTLTMKIAPASKGDPGTLVFLPRVKTNVPEADAPGSIFYADADFNLVREDPNQQKMDLRVAEAPRPGELKRRGAPEPKPV